MRNLPEHNLHSHLQLATIVTTLLTRLMRAAVTELLAFTELLMLSVAA